MKMRYQLIILVFIDVTHFEKTRGSDHGGKPMVGFFYSMPKVIVAGKNETVCVSTHHSSPSPVRITIDLKVQKAHFIIIRNIDAEHSCFDLQVPKQITGGPQNVGVKVQVRMDGTTYTAHNKDPIMIYSNKKMTVIETDRLTYKNTDTIKMRILSLGHDLKPVPNYKVPYVRVLNPLGVSVFVWENVTTYLGLAHLEYQLSQYSLTGKWKIEADGETKKVFEVNKYVLPRFKVYIEHPKVLYYKAQTLIKVYGRYSYGAYVNGITTATFTNVEHNINVVLSAKKMTNGCAEFFLPQNTLLIETKQKFFSPSRKIALSITATVTEHGTDKTESATTELLISLEPYVMKFKKDDNFLPGLPYNGVLEFERFDADPIDEVLEICYIVAVRKSWNYLNSKHCSTFTLKHEKFVKFQVPPLKSNIVHFQLNAKSMNHSNIEDNLLVVRIYSPSLSYIVLNPIGSSDALGCRTVQHFLVQYTTDKLSEGQDLTFYYMIKGRGQIFKMRKIVHPVRKYYPDYADTSTRRVIVGGIHDYSKANASISKFTLKFKVDRKVTSTYQLLVYYVTSDGELVSTTYEVKEKPCLTNEITASWSHKQILPGETASLLLETKSESFCSIFAIDKATTFMDGMNILDAKSDLKLFYEEKDVSESRRKSCIQPLKNTKRLSNLLDLATLEMSRGKRHVYTFAEDYDAYDVFEKFGIVTITNFKVVTKPCYTGPLTSNNNLVQFSTDQYDVPNEDNATPIRSFFPETWLWELVPVRNAAVIHRNLPHTITTWVTNVLCVSAVDGLGISKSFEITAFQPFFVQVLTPYSVKVGEILYLHTTVFNYLTYNIPVQISLSVTSDILLLSDTATRNFSSCVISNSTITHAFELKAMKAEKVNVTVTAELDSSYPRRCGPDLLVNKRDVVLKTIIVEPEGYPIQTTKSALLCGSGYNSTNEVTWKVELPTDIVSGTFTSELILSGCIVGYAIQHFDDLITMPTGCGEQIVAKLAPNFYVLRYLNMTDRLTSNLRHKIIRNLKVGYQGILNYIHKDGSFSAFGHYDPAGSMFLTAFVVRVLHQVKQHIYVNQDVLNRAVSWIFDHQLENGCFSTMHHVFQDMGGTNFENSTAGLTAYVVISLLDANVEIPEPVLTNAKYCIRGLYSLDKYTLAISSYALFKANWYSEASRMLGKLFQISNQKDNMMWWTSRDFNGSSAKDVEITSYVLLSLVHQRHQENLAKAHSIVQWLMTQQGPRGGFYSSHDTVVALDALTQYSHFVNHKTTNLNVSISIDHQEHTFEVSRKDCLKSRNFDILKNNTRVKIHTSGEGCVLTQIIQSYYAKSVATPEAFNLETEVLLVSKTNKCSSVTLYTCFSYNGPDHQSNMAVLEVDLPSGYEADRASLYRLINENETSGVRMFEEFHQKVVVYMTKLNSEIICINIDIRENVVVDDRTNSTIRLYDYYQPEYSTLKFYEMTDKCNITKLMGSDSFDKENAIGNVSVMN